MKRTERGELKMISEYSNVQKIAKDTIEYIKTEVRPGMTLKNVRQLCEDKMIELGADSFWYYDIGAFVWFAHIIEWEFPDFSVEKCFDRLLKMQEIIDRDGFVEGTIHRYLIVAKKK